ncbi:MAG: HEAT repeat domain-containing protein, partial [Candidatus Rokuibacteriota bacterium]
FQTVRTLDRLILDEPLESQPVLYGNLTEAVLLVEEPLRTALPRAFAARSAEDASAKFLLHQFSLDRLGELIVRAVRPEGVEDQVAPLLGGLALPERKNAALIALLEARLRPAGAPLAWLSGAIRARGGGTEQGRSPEVPPEFIFDDALILLPQDALAERIEEGRAITEAGAIREVVATLVDILRDESDEKELPEIAEALGDSLPWLVEQQEFGLLAAVLSRLKRVASVEDARGRLAAGIVRKITEHPLLDRLLDALWAGRETAVEGQVRSTLAVVADEVVTPLVRVLGSEPRSGMRSLLCDLLAVVARAHVHELAGFIADQRWYLVRNVANILGRLGNPDVVPFLERVIAHPEYRVRREVVDALARVGTEAAQTLLVRVLDDVDPRIQFRALQALNAWGARRAMARLLALLETPDPLHHLFPNKVAALEALERLRASEALPVLRRLARSPLAIGQHRRELRDLARRAVSAIEGTGAHDPREAGGERVLTPDG